MTIVEALKSIYNKWTGKTSEGNTIEEVLGELNADYTPGSGGGSNLPTPGTEGNVLTDNGTAWVSAAIPVNEYPVVFTFDGATVTCDKTIANIKSAIAAGKTVKGYGAGDWASAVFDLSVSVPGNDEFSMFAFMAAFNSDEVAGAGYAVTVYCTAESGQDDDFKYYLVNYSELPPAGADGNVLTADDGEWVSAAPPDATELVCTFTVGAQGVTCDQSISDIIAACVANRPVVGYLGGLRCDVNTYNEGNNHVVFRMISDGNNSITFIEIVGDVEDSSDVWDLDTDSELYTVPDPDDNDGKVLGANDGSVAWVSPSALSNAPMLIELTLSNGSYTTDKTCAEVLAAIAAHKVIQVHYHVDYSENVFGDVYYTFNGIAYDPSEGYYMSIFSYDDDEPSKLKHYELLAATTADYFTATG